MSTIYETTRPRYVVQRVYYNNNTRDLAGYKNKRVAKSTARRYQIREPEYTFRVIDTQTEQL